VANAESDSASDKPDVITGLSLLLVMQLSNYEEKAWCFQQSFEMLLMTLYH
jgi:mannose/fructose-specific phosphotransferase system component IIA